MPFNRKYDPSYLFMRGMQMLHDRDIEAAREIGDLIDADDENVRGLAQFFIHQVSADCAALSRMIEQPRAV